MDDCIGVTQVSGVVAFCVADIGVVNILSANRLNHIGNLYNWLVKAFHITWASPVGDSVGDSVPFKKPAVLSGKLGIAGVDNKVESCTGF